MYLIFDTETTGLPKNYDAPLSDADNWPRLVQIAWQLHDNTGKLINAKNLIVKPNGFTIPFNTVMIHGVTTEIALSEGKELSEVLAEFTADLEKNPLAIAHNAPYDLSVIGAEYLRLGQKNHLENVKVFDTQKETTDFVAIPSGKSGTKFKFPKLSELYFKLFNQNFEDAHDAAYDVKATAKAFFGLIEQKIIPPIDNTPIANIIYEPPILEDSNFAKRKLVNKKEKKIRTKKADGEILPFVHLHVHSEFSILQSTAKVKNILKKAQEKGMSAVAFTDLGNLHGAYNATNYASEFGVKAIIGCELFVAKERKRLQFTKNEKDERFQVVLLAKNKAGYKNLSKLVSLGYIEGSYSGFPRVDKDLIKEYKENLICLSGSLSGEISKLILNEGEDKAEKALLWWLDTFQDDFYLELVKHGLEAEEYVNNVLLDFADKYNIKVVASNDVYFLERKEKEAHDILLAVKDGEKMSTPVGYGRGKRYSLPNDDYYFKSIDEMNVLFEDIPEALTNTIEIADKCESYTLKEKINMPRFEMPAEFETEDDYLRYLTYEGAKERYGNPVPDDVVQRLDFELNTIKNMGFPGYFLIVQDFINAGRKMGVFVGPGRGCLIGDSKIVMKNGSTKSIKDIKINDEVYTIDGSVQKVKNTFKYESKEELLNIKCYYGDVQGVSLTKDHKILSSKNTTEKLSWKQAKDIQKNDWVFVPKIAVSSVQKNNHQNKEYNFLSFSEILADVSIIFSDDKIAFDDNFLNYDENEIITFLNEIKKIGQKVKFDVLFKIKSKIFAEQLKLLAWKICIPAFISNQKEIYHLFINFENKNYFYKKVPNGLLLKVREIKTVENKDNFVYDFEVEKHHNYLTSSFLVHNSAAGSAVAYCVGITNIDPILYNLLFERFLNPERVSMPDIDIDFDDERRGDVIDYVIKKYGRNQVAQIITYGTMAAKMAIKDVARVMELDLGISNQLAKLVPEKAGTKLKDAFNDIQDLKDILNGANNLNKKVLENALILEGSVRNTGIHAAGVIIAPNDILECVPVCTAKDADLFVTQFDGKVIEEAGMLKMDFLGLKTLTIIRDCLNLIQLRTKEYINIDKISFEDEKTYQLYQNGDTNGTFQFESEGMQMYLRQLKPTNIEDLIAMNSLYRPGPLAFIPLYIERKHGREVVEYAHPLLEKILKDTFGIMVYQEQIMQTAQLLAGYSLGGADLLRRAMGKKKKEEMDKQREIFVKGSKEKNDIPAEKANEIFDIMQKFAEYGFNRSHSAAYSVVAYQTAYLKANYPAEYMAAVLTHNMTIEKVTFFLDECNKMSINVLGPDVNESSAEFIVNEEGKIRFGLAAIKGTGEAAIESIIEERKKGHFKDIFDFASRINLRTVNKKSFESMAQAGAFDSFGINRAAYFSEGTDKSPFIEKLIKYGNALMKDKESSKNSLFGGKSEVKISTPAIPTQFENWSKIEKLSREKEVVGFFISGHPLDEYKAVMNRYKSIATTQLENYDKQEVYIAGTINNKNIKQTQKGTSFTTFFIEDYQGSLEVALFGQDHDKFSEQIIAGENVLLKGKVQKNYRGDKFELKLIEVKDLSQLKLKSATGIKIAVPLQEVTPIFIQNLTQLLITFSGDMFVKLEFFDKNNPQIRTTATSNKYKVNANDHNLIAKLENLNVSCEVV